LPSVPPWIRSQDFGVAGLALFELVLPFAAFGEALAGAGALGLTFLVVRLSFPRLAAGNAAEAQAVRPSAPATAKITNRFISSSSRVWTS
jgi:predicted dienelactone hydrolase